MKNAGAMYKRETVNKDCFSSYSLKHYIIKWVHIILLFQVLTFFDDSCQESFQTSSGYTSNFHFEMELFSPKLKFWPSTNAAFSFPHPFINHSSFLEPG